MAKKPSGRLQLGSPRRTCEDNTGTNRKKISCKDVNRISINLNYGVQYYVCLIFVFY
jgi:hypothetical protein